METYVSFRDQENFMLKLQGRSFRCLGGTDACGVYHSCGCNVFHRPNPNDPDLYKCNACGETWRVDYEEAASG